MENKRNYYRILHVQFDAPPSVIKASYRTMMQKLRLHPDLGGEELNARLINEARDVLLNPTLRAEYDQQQSFAANAPGRRSERPRSESTVGGRPNCEDDHVSENSSDVDSHSRDQPQESVKELLYFEACKQCQFCRNPVSQKKPTLMGYPTAFRCSSCKAPLGKVENYQSVSRDDPRNSHRTYLEQSVKIWEKWPRETSYDALVWDWSTAGCCVELEHSIKVNSVILLLSPIFDAIATVRYNSDSFMDKKLLGLEFMTLEVKMDPGSIFVSTA